MAITSSVAMSSKRRRMSLLLAFLTALILALLAVLVWEASTQLTAPPRRPLQDYHVEWLKRPADHGIAIEAVTCLDGQVPCLLVEPDGTAGPAQRGKTLRLQLGQMGYQLPAYGDIRGTLVLLHGRRGRKEDLLPVAERFCAAGYRCILPDLPAHGESPVSTVHFGQEESLERSLPHSILTEVSSQFGFAPKPAGLWGMSMGGSFATRNAADQPDTWDSLVIVSSFDELHGLVEEQFHQRAWYFSKALSPIAQEVVIQRGGVRFQTVQPSTWAQDIEIPVLVAHGDQDQTIPMERGQELYQAFASQKKQWVKVEGGDHNNVLITPMPLYATMAAWFLDH